MINLTLNPQFQNFNLTNRLGIFIINLKQNNENTNFITLCKTPDAIILKKIKKREIIIDRRRLEACANRGGVKMPGYYARSLLLFTGAP